MLQRIANASDLFKSAVLLRHAERRQQRSLQYSTSEPVFKRILHAEAAPAPPPSAAKTAFAADSPAAAGSGIRAKQRDKRRRGRRAAALVSALLLAACAASALRATAAVPGGQVLTCSYHLGLAVCG